MQVGLTQERKSLVAHADTEALLWDVLVVAEHLGLGPCERLVQLSEDRLRITHERRHEVHPRRRCEWDALYRSLPIDLQLVGRRAHGPQYRPWPCV